MIYRLQGCKKSAFIGWMAGMLLLAGCTQDKLVDASQGEILPEGKYPVTFTATGLGTTATTRATAGGTWTKEDKVAVQVNSNGVDEIKEYAAADGSSASTTLKAAEGVTPFYWQSTSDMKVSAWYPGTEYGKEGSLPAKWSVKTDQNSSNGYQQSDFLYAPQSDIDFKGTKSLTFYHQTAKVVVNIRNNGLAAAVGNTNISVSIKAISEGTFNVNADDRLSASGTSYADITPQTITDANTNVVFEDNKTGETALASYQALVIPQAANKTTIIINITGYAPFTYIPTVSDASGNWAGGTQYTYNLTIDGKEVKATVTADKISWGDKEGGSGAGSVEI